MKQTVNLGLPVYSDPQNDKYSLDLENRGKERIDVEIDSIRAYAQRVETKVDSFLTPSGEALPSITNIADLELVKQNQLELLIQRDLEGKSTTMDVGYWFDTLKDKSKVSTYDGLIENNTYSCADGTTSATIEFIPHAIGFRTDNVTFYHRRNGSNITIVHALHDTDVLKMTIDNTTITYEI